MTDYELQTIELSKAIKRLNENPDFQTVILSKFIDTQALTLVKYPESPEDNLEALKAISYLSQWLETSLNDGIMILQHNKGV